MILLSLYGYAHLMLVIGFMALVLHSGTQYNVKGRVSSRRRIELPVNFGRNRNSTEFLLLLCIRQELQVITTLTRENNYLPT